MIKPMPAETSQLRTPALICCAAAGSTDAAASAMTAARIT